jgi:Lrp/AsnC ligand binding domain
VVTAYILIQTEVGKAAQVAKEIAEIKGVQQAEDVTGPYDVIVRAEARNLPRGPPLGGAHSRPTSQSIARVRTSRSAGSIAGNMAIRSWLRPSLR